MNTRTVEVRPNLLMEAIPQLKRAKDRFYLDRADEDLRSGLYRRGIWMQTCRHRKLGDGVMILERIGRDQLTLGEEIDKARAEHSLWHSHQRLAGKKEPCSLEISRVIFAPKFPPKKERGMYENRRYTRESRYNDTDETRQLFSLSDDSLSLASRLKAPEYRNGRLVSGNCSIELIGSSPAGNVLYGTPGVTETWTQLPRLSEIMDAQGIESIRRGVLESMYAQVIEGIPGLILDAANERVLGDLDSITPEQVAQVESDFLVIFGHQLTNLDQGMQILDKYRISDRFAAGLYHLLDEKYGQPLEAVEIRGSGRPAAAVKGQVIGIVSFGIRIVDHQTLKPIIHHEKYDTVAKTLMLKAAWMREYMAHFTGNPNIRMNADEPYLVEAWNQSLGIPEDKIIRLLRTQQAVLGENGGVHCCGITNYRALFESGTRVVELDLTGDEFNGSWETANYAQTFVATAGEAGLQGFLDRGGQLGLGIVQFNKNISVEQTVGLAQRILSELHTRNIRIDARQLIITPVCGAGSVKDIEDAQAGFNNLPIVALRLQQELGIAS